MSEVNSCQDDENEKMIPVGRGGGSDELLASDIEICHNFQKEYSKSGKILNRPEWKLSSLPINCVIMRYMAPV